MSELPQALIFVDTETDPLEIGGDETVQRLELGYAEHWQRRGAEYVQRGHLDFTEAADFWAWAHRKTRPKGRTWVIAHNMGGFDAAVLALGANLSALGYDVVRMVLALPPFLVDARRSEDGRSLRVVDSLNWFRVPLAELGDRHGLPKYAHHRDAGPEHLQAYCRRDVEILRTAILAWIRFVESEDLGTFRPTIAGQALTAFQHRFQVREGPNRLMTNRSPEVTALERAAYAGGRVEAWRLGEIPESVHQVDVNSMYAAVMAAEVFPVRYLRSRRRPTIEWLEGQLRAGYGAVAEVLLATPEPAYPLKREDRLVFPIGQFWTALTTPELAYALLCDHVRDVGMVHLYHMAPMFQGWVNYWFHRRGEYQARGDAVMAQLAKDFLTHLYGKFGQRAATWGPPDGHLVPYADWDGGLANLSERRPGSERRQLQLRRFEGHVEQSVPAMAQEVRHSMPAVAAHVTAHARLRLWKASLLAGQAHVLYMDTDSLVVTDAGLANMTEEELIGAGLGLWRLVESIPGGLVIYGLKDYIAGDRIVRKGVRKGATQVSPDTFQQEHFVSLLGAILAGHPDQGRTRLVTKTLSREYLKGRPMPDGSVLPLIVMDDDKKEL